MSCHGGHSTRRMFVECRSFAERSANVLCRLRRRLPRTTQNPKQNSKPMLAPEVSRFAPPTKMARRMGGGVDRGAMVDVDVDVDEDTVQEAMAADAARRLFPFAHTGVATAQAWWPFSAPVAPVATPVASPAPAAHWPFPAPTGPLSFAASMCKRSKKAQHVPRVPSAQACAAPAPAPTLWTVPNTTPKPLW